MEHFTFIDLFCGIGGFHRALSSLGGECLLACDIDDKARAVYEQNYHTPLFYGDIFGLSSSEVPDHDILCGGFPCQPFSISGRQGGFKDERASVFAELVRIIRDKQPKIFILENVKHIQHVSGGKVFDKILGDLHATGYHIEWKVLNANDFGLAQNRERVFFVGTKYVPFDFNQLKTQKKRFAVRDILDHTGPFEFLEEGFTLIEKPILQKSGLKFVGYRNKAIRKIGVRRDTRHLSRVHKQPNRIYSIDGVHPTLPSQESAGRFWILLDNGKVRKLTLRECYRLMGFGDDFINGQSPGTQYTQIGNSVCVPVVRALVHEMINQGFLVRDEFRQAI